MSLVFCCLVAGCATPAAAWRAGDEADAPFGDGRFLRVRVQEVAGDRVRVGAPSAGESRWVDAAALAPSGTKAADPATSGEILTGPDGKLLAPPGGIGLAKGGGPQGAPGQLGFGRKRGAKVRLTIVDECKAPLHGELGAKKFEVGSGEVLLEPGTRIVRRGEVVATVGAADDGFRLDVCAKP